MKFAEEDKDFCEAPVPGAGERGESTGHHGKTARKNDDIHVVTVTRHEWSRQQPHASPLVHATTGVQQVPVDSVREPVVT